jgi:hypothetical protein
VAISRIQEQIIPVDHLPAKGLPIRYLLFLSCNDDTNNSTNQLKWWESEKGPLKGMEKYSYYGSLRIINVPS